MKLTRNHDEIRQWAEAHDGIPAEIIPLKFDGQPSILHFLFGNAKAGTPELRAISWEDFFARFDLMELSIRIDEDFAIYEIIPVDKPARPGMSH